MGWIQVGRGHPLEECELTLQVRVEMLKGICDPYDGLWEGLTIEMVREELAKNVQRKYTDIEIDDDEMADVKLIAYFVRNGWFKPIEIDVGVVGYRPPWIVTDGNHRFAAAIYRGDETINCSCSGALELVNYRGHKARGLSSISATDTSTTFGWLTSPCSTDGSTAVESM